MKRISLFFTTILALGLIFATSCIEEKNTDPIIASSEDDAEVSALFNEVDDEASDQSNLKSAMIEGYDSTGGRNISDTLIAGQRIITIVYDNFVNGKNSRIKNGKIIITIAGKYVSQAAPFQKVITFEDFTINGNLIEGTRTITKDSLDPLKFHIKLIDGKITFTDGTTYTRTVETRTRTWTAGSDTPFNIWDDEYTIEGSAEGTNKKGETYVHTITTPLQIALVCPWIKAGAIQFVVGEGTSIKTASINYGDGKCDEEAIVTLNLKTYNIKLRGGK